MDDIARRLSRNISEVDRFDRETSLFVIESASYDECMSTVPFDLEQLAFDLAEHGVSGFEPALADVVHLARTYGVGGAAVGVLADRTAPDVARLRAFGAVAAALLPVTGDRLATPLRSVA
jgi:hypothetical protein